MKITRKIDTHSFIQSNKAAKPKRNRRVRRYISNNQSNQICYADQLDQYTNNPYNFTYADPDRSIGMSKVLKLHYDRMFHNYGVNLLYFRKYNTFFKENQQNHANMVYGQDTTAEYFLSSYVRGYLNITKQDWQFNMMGYQSQQEIQIWFTIDEFRARFATVLGIVSSDLFAVPVTADLINKQYYGKIDVPQFYADIYGTLTNEQLNTLYLDHVYPQITQRPINSISYKTLVRVQPLQPLTGLLKGQLQLCKNDQFYATGYLKGQIMYHSLQNIQNSPGWNLAPQVGDFFKLKSGQIQQDYEINQIIDKQMAGNDALNMFLQHYVYKCTAVRRMASEEEIHKPEKEIGSDKQQLFQNNNQDAIFNTPEEEFKGIPFIKDKKDKKNIMNKKANKLATKIYNYNQNEDNIYGGYGNSEDPQIQNPHFQKL